MDKIDSSGQQPIGYRWRHSACEKWQYSSIPCGWEYEPLYELPKGYVDSDVLQELADRWASDRLYNGSPSDDIRELIEKSRQGK